jgi:hypothetical protein
MTSLVKLKSFCKVFGKMVVVVASMSHVGKKPREATMGPFGRAFPSASPLASTEALPNP